MENYQLEDINRIDMGDIFRRILIKWKIAFIFGLVFGFGLAGLKYYKNKKNANDIVASLGQAEEKVLSDKEQANVNDAAAMLKRLAYQTNYYENSYLMTINPDNEKKVTLSYYIDCSDASYSNVVMNLMKNYITSDDFINKLLPLFPDVNEKDKKAYYVKELFTFESVYYSDDKTSTVISSGDQKTPFTLNIIVPDGVDVDKLVLEVNKLICSKENNMFSDEVKADYSIVFLSATVNTLYDWSLINSQNAQYKNVLSLETDSKTLNLSAVELEAVKSKLEGIYMEESVKLIIKSLEQKVGDIYAGGCGNTLASDGVAPASKNSIKVYFSKKFFVLGFAVGIVFYVICYFIVLLLPAKLMDIDIDRLGIYEFGSYSEYKPNGLKKILSSKMVFNMIYGRIPQDEQLSKINNSIKAYCKHNNIEDIGIISSRKNEKGFNEALSKAVKVKNRVVSIDEDLYSFESDKLIYVYNEGVTKEEEFVSFLRFCRQYDKKIVGIIKVCN